ncbi:MAG: radical SAM protein [Promethearchaeia archaeon]
MSGIKMLIVRVDYEYSAGDLTFKILQDGRKILESPFEATVPFMEDAFQSRVDYFGNELLCYSPTAYPYRIDSHKQANRYNFRSLSITGLSCSLMCEHCKGRLLKGMDPAVTPEDLMNECQKISERGGEGVLISGGSDSSGYVPLNQFSEAIAYAKELGLKVVVHTGLVTEETALMLKRTDVDAAMLDIIGSLDVAKRIYHLEDGKHRMRKSLRLLTELEIPTTPHILVGLNYGQLGGELKAIDMVADFSPAALVIIILTPIRNTPMENVTPPAPEVVGKLLTVARLGLKQTPLLLGCARPLGNHKILTDRLAIRAGVNGLSLPSQEGVDFAKEKGLHPVFLDVCCSLAYQSLP